MADNRSSAAFAKATTNNSRPAVESRSLDREHLHGLKSTFITKASAAFKGQPLRRPAFRTMEEVGQGCWSDLDVESKDKSSNKGHNLRKALKVTSKGANMRVGVELMANKAKPAPPSFSAIATKPPTTASLRRGRTNIT